MNKVIDVHFTNGQVLRLSGKHVPKFFDSYTQALMNQSLYLESEAEEHVLINMKEVCFIDEHPQTTEDKGEPSNV